MSRRTPKYRHHKPSGQAAVTLNGHDHYLGKWNTAESRKEYDRLIAEWLIRGRSLPAARATTSAISVNEFIFNGSEDTTTSPITGSTTVTIQAAPANHLFTTASLAPIAGAPFDGTVAALDPYGNVDTNYTGTVSFTSSDTDPGVLLPANYTFQPSDNGTHTFASGATLITPGNQTLTATDTANSFTGSATVTVSPAPTPPPGGGASGPRLQLRRLDQVLNRFSCWITSLAPSG